MYYTGFALAASASLFCTQCKYTPLHPISRMLLCSFTRTDLSCIGVLLWKEGNTGKTREMNMLYYHCFIPQNCSLVMQSPLLALLSQRWAQEVCAQIHTHRTRPYFLFLSFIHNDTFCSNFERSNTIISLCTLSESKAFWTGIWAAAAYQKIKFKLLQVGGQRGQQTTFV